jgi:hypothetical protein
MLKKVPFEATLLNVAAPPIVTLPEVAPNNAFWCAARLRDMLEYPPLPFAGGIRSELPRLSLNDP